jgi:hypothetical protein
MGFFDISFRHAQSNYSIALEIKKNIRLGFRGLLVISLWFLSNYHVVSRVIWSFT